MIKSMNIKNFKAFKESGWLNFKKINILVGPNSSGKSSFLKALLLLDNTIKSEDVSSALDLPEEIGAFESIVYGNNTKDKLFFDIDFQVRELKTDELKLASLILLKVFSPLLQESSNNRFFTSIKEPFNDLFTPEKFADMYKNSMVKRFSFSIKSTRKNNISVDNFKFVTYNNDTYEIFQSKKSYYLMKNNNTIDIPNLFKPYKFFFKLNNKNISKCTDNNTLEEVFNVVFAFSHMERDISNFTNKIVHIEPFRNTPKRLEYVTNVKTPYNSVGSKGENMLSTILSLKSTEESKNKGSKSILTKINYWLNAFDLAEEAYEKDLGDNHYSWMIKNKYTGIPCNIVDVGVGTSQLLPIIIESVNSPAGSILLIEEPETHIHPGAQAKLADLFVECATKQSKMFFVETHSMYLITQLEILVAQKKIKAEDIGIYYFNQDKNGTHVMDMKLCDNGQFEDEWPSGFFDVPYQLSKKLFEEM